MEHSIKQIATPAAFSSIVFERLIVKVGTQLVSTRNISYPFPIKQPYIYIPSLFC